MSSQNNDILAKNPIAFATRYANWITILESQGWLISGDTEYYLSNLIRSALNVNAPHAYFYHQTSDGKLNVIEFVLIAPSFNYDYEIRVRETVDIRHKDAKTETLTGLDVAYHKVTDEDIERIALDYGPSRHTPVTLVFEDQEMLVFDEANEEDVSYELLFDSHSGYDIVSYYNGFTGDYQPLSVSDPNCLFSIIDNTDTSQD